MRPDATRVLYTVAGALAAQVAPQVATPFGQQTAGLSAMMATILAQEFDRAAARLVEENAAIVALFSSATAAGLDSTLATQIAAAVSDVRPVDFHVSALQARNDELRGLLVALHAAVEESDTPAGRALNDAIWDELKESTRRRHIVAAAG